MIFLPHSTGREISIRIEVIIYHVSKHLSDRQELNGYHTHTRPDTPLTHEHLDLVTFSWTDAEC